MVQSEECEWYSTVSYERQLVLVQYLHSVWSTGVGPRRQYYIIIEKFKMHHARTNEYIPVKYR